MAIIICLFSPTLEIPQEFPAWSVLAKLSASPATTHSRDRSQLEEKSLKIQSQLVEALIKYSGK